MPKRKSVSSPIADDEQQSARDSKAGDKSEAKETAAHANGSAADPGTDGLAMLKSQRQEIRAHLSALQPFKPDAEHVDHLRKLYVAWSKHAWLADEIVLAAFEQAQVELDRVHELLIEHDVISILMSDLMGDLPDEHMFSPKLRVLTKRIASILDAEEHKSKGLFAKAKGTELNLEELGHELKDAMSTSWFKAEEFVSDFKPRHLRGTGGRNYKKEQQMPMRGQDRDRDEYGRFMPDDDRGGSHRGSRGMRGGYDDDRRHGGYQGGYRSRSHENDDYGHSSRSHSGGRSQYDDDRNYRSQSSSRGSRRTGGWFGDSEGHSEASRRGWDSPNHGDSGWFGDSEGHAEASRRGWRNPNHGDSGWYGDSQGHSEASRRGWEGRRQEDDDYRSRRSGGSRGGNRNRDYDD